MIEVRNLRKQFKGRPTVEGVSFTAPDGAITGILGPNGAGKSTTLRMICGALHPDGGTVRIDGIEGDGDLRLLQKRLGVLPDHTGIYSRLTARENISYFGELHGMPSAMLAERIAEVVAVLDMERISARLAAGFSQGERMKTALGRVLVHNPQNLLLDEPTNGLDVLTIRALRMFLKKLRDEGKCILLSSHILDEVRNLCDYVIVIAHGRVVGQGAPNDLLQQCGSTNLEDVFVELVGSKEENGCPLML